MGNKFEKVSRFSDIDFNMPERKTSESAGYDMVVAEDVTIPSYFHLYRKMDQHNLPSFFSPFGGINERFSAESKSLNEVADLTKALGTRPTLVSTGVKCKLDSGTYLELTVRSSSPLKYWLIMGNGIGIIDADYYNNPDNEGEIFFQIINLSPFDICLHKGDVIGQGIIKPYLMVENDQATGSRNGGFGSTSNEENTII